MNAQTAKAIEKLSPAEIRQRFPKEFRQLQEALKEKEKKARPSMPPKLFKELEKERHLLENGREIRLPPSKKYPFEIRFRAQWEYDETAELQDVEIFAGPKQTANEKRLISLLKDSLEYSGIYDYDDVVDYIHEAPEVRAFKRQISNFCNRLDKFAEVYDFDPDDVLE